MLPQAKGSDDNRCQPSSRQPVPAIQRRSSAGQRRRLGPESHDAGKRPASAEAPSPTTPGVDVPTAAGLPGGPDSTNAAPGPLSPVPTQTPGQAPNQAAGLPSGSMFGLMVKGNCPDCGSPLRDGKCSAAAGLCSGGSGAAKDGDGGGRSRGGSDRGSTAAGPGAMADVSMPNANRSGRSTGAAGPRPAAVAQNSYNSQDQSAALNGAAENADQDRGGSAVPTPSTAGASQPGGKMASAPPGGPSRSASQVPEARQAQQTGSPRQGHTGNRVSDVQDFAAQIHAANAIATRAAAMAANPNPAGGNQPSLEAIDALRRIEGTHSVRRAKSRRVRKTAEVAMVKQRHPEQCQRHVTGVADIPGPPGADLSSRFADR